MGFKKEKRQQIVDDYLAKTGRNQYVPADFVDWLKGQPDHEAYDTFYGKSDAEEARASRIWRARQFVSGLRISVSRSKMPDSATVHAIERSGTVGRAQVFPAYVSPEAGRKSGGGYFSFDPNDKDHVAELRRQGSRAMLAWQRRYAAVFNDCDMSTIDEIAGLTAPRVVKSA